MRFAITGTDARFLPLRKLLLADGHEITDPASADMVISPPWDSSARYAHLEEYQIANAQLTAEGAVALLRPETGLSGAHVLLLGYGRIARLLARELQKAGALVTAAARSGEQRAWAEAEGIEALPLDALSGALDRFDVIIGTIPAPVLTEPLLALVRKDALLLELASAPGGIDAAAAHERGLRYIRAPGLPAKYAPERAAVILRDAVYAAAAEPLPRLGLAVTGSHCTFSRALEAFRPLKRDYTLVPILSGAAAGTDTRFFAASAFRAELEAFCGREAVDTIVKAEPLGTAQRLDALLVAPCTGSTLVPILSGAAAGTDTRFFAASAFRAELEAFCGREAVDTIVKAEPLGTAQRLDALLVAPCTGSTLAKLARGVTDTAVTMACKAHLRNGAPLILAISTNDGLSGSAESIAALLQRKNVYFVPFRQDAPHQKPFSLQSDFDLLGETIKAAMEGRQLQPVLL